MMYTYMYIMQEKIRNIASTGANLGQSKYPRKGDVGTSVENQRRQQQGVSQLEHEVRSRLRPEV